MKRLLLSAALCAVLASCGGYVKADCSLEAGSQLIPKESFNDIE